MSYPDQAAVKTPPLISLVLPVYNEEAGIAQFHDQILAPALMLCPDESFEIIYVDDGSRDQSQAILAGIASRDPRVQLVSLSRNFGKEIATTAGISEARGDALIILDSDGQHPPTLLPKLIAAWRAGAQVVVGVRASNQGEGTVKRIGSKLFYRMLNSISDMQTVPRSTDFRLLDSAVRTEFLRFGEHNRITRGLIDWLGFEREYIEFDSPARLAGDATYTASKLFRLALNSFTMMSLRPLFIFGYVGIAITIIALLIGIGIGVEQFVLGDPLGLNFSGSALLSIFVAFLVGLVLTAQGIMAVYLSHVHVQAQNRPLFVVNQARSRLHRSSE
ncbi:MAG: glycosyltransferase [Aeromicrobium sp.]|nr:MAG: glycosyltransferase [Aeromicrobium sp.]